jgi:hypothetical protein
MATLNKSALNITFALSAVCLSALSYVAPSYAMTLNGYLEENQSVTASGGDKSTQASTTGTSSGGIAGLTGGISALQPNSFPKAFEGTWECNTTVVDSSSPSVAAGQVINSEATFYATTGGRIQGRWNQAGWVESQCTAESYGPDQAKSDRTTYYYGDNSQGSWAARSRDQFALTAPDTMSAKSYVDQYINGQFAGRYRTVSVLKKVAAAQNIAER